jgi:hypothetical protein
MKMDNLKYYEMGRSVPKEAQKAFNNGKFQGTDINPMWRIKKLTEMFGPAGIGWYTEVLCERCEGHGENTIAVVNINLYVKVDGEWSKPIYGTGGNIVNRKGTANDEGYKMAYTDALSVACKALGIGADIYFDKDKTKYTANEIKEEPKKEEPKEQRASARQIELLAKTYKGENLAKLLKANGIEKIEDLPMSKASELIAKLNARKEKAE